VPVLFVDIVVFDCSWIVGSGLKESKLSVLFAYDACTPHFKCPEYDLGHEVSA
jgi:hypothetical protein